MVPERADRRAALRSLLIEQVEATAPSRRMPAVPPSRGEPGRLRMALITGAVAAAVVLASIVALQLAHQRVGPVAAPVSTAAPSPTPSLITPTGWQRLTRDQLHAFVASSSTLQQEPYQAAIWEEEAWLDIRCMAAAGYVYDPIAAERSDTSAPPGLTARQRQQYAVELYGPQLHAPVDGTEGGCHGRSVQESGQSGAH